MATAIQRTKAIADALINADASATYHDLSFFGGNGAGKSVTSENRINNKKQGAL